MNERPDIRFGDIIAAHGRFGMVKEVTDELLFVGFEGDDEYVWISRNDVTNYYPAVRTLDRCRICGKHEHAPHTANTRRIHGDHMARYGWSGMCKVL